MEYVIAVFQTRNSALKCYNMLVMKGLDVKVISTPKIKGLGCGICVKLNKQEYMATKNLLNSYQISDFLGFYEIKKQYGELVAKKI